MTELNATFFAFRKRERKGVLLTTSIAYFALVLLLSAALLAVLWPYLAPFIGWYGEVMQAAMSGDSDAITTPPLSGWPFLAVGYAIWTLAFFVLMAAYEAACLKWMIHGEREGFLGLSLGADTWRVFASYWVWMLGGIAIYVVLILIIVAIAALAAAGAPTWVTMLIGLLTPIGFIVSLIFFGVRFAPATATSVAERRFAFFDAWKVTKGRFWELLGAFVIAIAIYLGISMAVSTLTSPFIFGSIMSKIDMRLATTDEEAFLRSYMEAISGMFTDPAMLAIMIVSSLLSFGASLVTYLMFYGVNARAAQAALEEGKIAAA